MRAKLSFESKCLACHSIGGGDKLGPDLLGTTKRHDVAWLTKWLKSPEQMLQTDAKAKAMLERWKIPMPNQGLSDEEIKGYIEYFKWADQNIQPKAGTTTAAAPGGAASGPATGAAGSSTPGASAPAGSASGTVGSASGAKR